MSEPGYIYILMNASMPKLLKIGKTTKPPETRASELSSGTGIPSPFWVAHKVRVSDCDEAEFRAHNELREFRVNEDREFFAPHSLQTAISVLNAIEIEMPFIQAEVGLKPQSACIVTTNTDGQIEDVIFPSKETSAIGFAARDGNPESMFKLGNHFAALGESGEAQKWFLKAAQRGNIEACLWLERLGKAVEHGNIEKALAYYWIAANAGSDSAKAKLDEYSGILPSHTVERIQRIALGIIPTFNGTKF